jgi:hypothetical protein
MVVRLFLHQHNRREFLCEFTPIFVDERIERSHFLHLIKIILIIIKYSDDLTFFYHYSKLIIEDEMVYVKMRYPKRKGFTEIKAYLRNEGKFICEECFNKK